MAIMKKILLILFMLVTGCATEQKYIDYCNAFRGAREKSVIQFWGIPNKTYEADGYKYLTYFNHDAVYTHASYNTIYSGNYANTTGYSSRPVDLDCETTFILKNGKVKDYTYKGNDCRM
jgi:hypothetical protein